MPPLSVCPYCGAKGVKQFDPLIKDGFVTDRPYCGRCGKNYPAEKEPAPAPLPEWR